MSYLKQVEALAKQHGVECIILQHGHVQLRGDLLVNYYPESKKRTAYVAGTTKGRKLVSPSEAVGMCFTAPPIVGKEDRDKRSKDSRKKRAALIKKGVKACFWCQAPVTIDTSTLEHKIPLARGGLDNANNRTLACYDCNNGRGHDIPELDK